MQIRARAYPHPVLSPFGDDVVDVEFQATVAVEPTREAYQLSSVMQLSCHDLKSLIAQGRAAYAIHVECPTTRYRRLFIDTDERFSAVIPAPLLDDRVDICSFVLATVDLPSYRNANFNLDYQGVAFSVRKGDTLAVSQDQVFYAEKQDALKKFASIFSLITANDNAAPALAINLERPKIVIELSKANYSAYAALKQDQGMPPVLNSMLIVPALVEAITDIRARKQRDELYELEEWRWFRVLSAALKRVSGHEDGGESETPLALALKVAGDPITKGLDNLRHAMDEEDD